MTDKAKKLGGQLTTPIPRTFGNRESHIYGLTKREYFAAFAMQGLLLCKVAPSLTEANVLENLAAASVLCADALLEELANNAEVAQEGEK
jgi:hypothetical protein